MAVALGANVLEIRCFLIEPVERFREDGGNGPWWRRVDTGEEGANWSFPVGAMWWAPWMTYGSKIHKDERGDGPHLIVRTPGGDWDIDGPSSNGDGWHRTGEPPNVTASPSIGFVCGDGSWHYHGWLRDGVLTDA